jgi:hypothetical protein
VPYASNKPIVTCFGSKSNVTKLITRAKVSSAPLLIQRSNVVVTHTRTTKLEITFILKIQKTENLFGNSQNCLRNNKTKNYLKIHSYLEIYKTGQGVGNLT